jgi:hypothetical protein
MVYQAALTAQIRYKANPLKDTGLEVHELRTAGGRTFCGNGTAPHHLSHKGQPLELVSLGPGKVTCGSCQRITGH